MERPPARPEGALIRLAREAAGMTLPEAAKASGISKARWSQVETGYETRYGVTKIVQAKAATIAHMAHAAGITPERLEVEGQRPDAAGVLREILRSEPPSLRPVPAPDPPPAADPDFPEDDDDAVSQLIKGDPALEAIWRLRDADGKPYPREERIRLMRAHLEGMRARARRAERDTGT